MRKFVASLLVIALILLPYNNFVFAQEIDGFKAAVRNTINEGEISPDYVFALNTTNRFLNAWRERNFQGGMSCITDNLKSKVAKEELVSFFSGASKSQHLAYEVVGWKYIDKNTIRFHVWLYEYVAGQSSNPINHLDPFYIELVRVDKDKWLVDVLPTHENYYNGADNVWNEE